MRYTLRPGQIHRRENGPVPRTPLYPETNRFIPRPIGEARYCSHVVHPTFLFSSNGGRLTLLTRLMSEVYNQYTRSQWANTIRRCSLTVRRSHTRYILQLNYFNFISGCHLLSFFRQHSCHNGRTYPQPRGCASQ
jgi:hypothetical protein